MDKENEIIKGDCIEVMQNMEENSIDAVVTDPPYGLAFMGKSWDDFEPKEYQEFCEEWGREALRVLKPGGHLLSFSGTRTFHRMVVGLEDAGFEIRDTIAWIYGCLSEDTEILTENGWEQYHKDIVNSPVLCYDKDKDSFEFHKPIRDFHYENKHTAYRIKSNKTDQIVSRNHRVLVEREGRKTFERAEQLARKSEASIPFLESLSELPDAIPNPHKGTSVQKQDLLKRVCGQSNIGKEKREDETKKRKKIDRGNLRQLWRRVLETDLSFEAFRKTLLFLRMQWQSTGRGMEKTRPQRQRELVGGKRAETERENDGRNQSRLEGWSNLFQKQGQLSINKICEMSRRLFRYGTQGWLCSGTSVNNGSITGQMFNQRGGSSSYKSRPSRQQNRKSDVVSEQQGTQNIRGTRAKVEPIEYDGNVWCVEVPTGAFVARRNGKIFITGNSGFPKNHDISKAIDREAGAEREVVGESPNNRTAHKKGGAGFDKNIGKDEGVDLKITKPATEEAKEWEGWGTALKPALEPITVARKPISEDTIAENVLEHGTGALNIDGSRIDHPDADLSAEQKDFDNMGYHGAEDTEGVSTYDNKGRYPTNLIHDGSEEATKGMGDKSRYFYCPKAKKSERNRGCDNLKNKSKAQSGGARQAEKEGKEEYKKDSIGLNEIKKVKNHHPTVKPIDLMEYLVRLVSREEQIILDPFIGSGSTAIACKRIDRNWIGIERNEEYIKIAEARIDADVQGKMF